MIKFDYDDLAEQTAEYLKTHDKNEPLANDIEYLFGVLTELKELYKYGEVPKVLHAICMKFEDEEDYEEMQQSLRGVKGENIANIAANFGFLYGILYAVNKKDHS